MQLDTLRTFLIDELQEVYASELLIEDVMTRLGIGASAPQLKALFRQEKDQAKSHTNRLETVFSKLQDSPRGGHGASVKAILREGENRLGVGGDDNAVDASLITAARRLEHWKIATYETLKIYSEKLSLSEVAGLLNATLTEAQDMDARLTELARTMNAVAAQEQK